MTVRFLKSCLRREKKDVSLQVLNGSPDKQNSGLGPEQQGGGSSAWWD